jgi:hypothetical protein
MVAAIRVAVRRQRICWAKQRFGRRRYSGSAGPVRGSFGHSTASPATSGSSSPRRRRTPRLPSRRRSHRSAACHQLARACSSPPPRQADPAGRPGASEPGRQSACTAHLYRTGSSIVAESGSAEPGGRGYCSDGCLASQRSRSGRGPGTLVRCRMTRPSTSARLPTIAAAVPRTHLSSRPC